MASLPTGMSALPAYLQASCLTTPITMKIFGRGLARRNATLLFICDNLRLPVSYFHIGIGEIVHCTGDERVTQHSELLDRENDRATEPFAVM